MVETRHNSFETGTSGVILRTERWSAGIHKQGISWKGKQLQNLQNMH